MKRILFSIAAAFASLLAFAQDGGALRTLRVDYVFCGNSREVKIYLDNLHDAGPWWGRQVNLDKMPPVRGNGSIVMRDAESGKVLYANTFSTLFQEWLMTEEATAVSKSFENVFLLPMPAGKADVTVSLTNEKGETTATLTHRVDPQDILISKTHPSPQGRQVEYIFGKGSSREKIDVVIVAEGYTAAEKDKFFEHARTGADAIFSHDAFKASKDRFNVIAVFLPSAESGVSIPGKGIWRNTALDSNYNTFYMDRYLTTTRLKKLHDSLTGIPYEHIIILANDETYGGGGIYNSYTLTTSLNPKFKQVIAHEFGHSFGALADEYAYDDMYSTWYPAGVEPWEKNITTCVDFSSKWEDMVGTEAPNGKLPAFKVGLYEGAGYQSKGAFRPVDGCLMRILNDKDGNPSTFCPVCTRAIGEMVKFSTEE